MFSLPLRQRLDSAHAVFSGRYGDVTRLARDRGVFRQTLYRQAQAFARDADPAYREQTQARLRQQVLELQAERDRLQKQLSQACVLDADKVAQFAATAQALGVSLSAARELLTVLLNQRAVPSVSRLGRLSKQAAQQAAATLAVLDEFSRPRAEQVAADEIFVGRRPVLMTIEQHSLCWLGGRLAPSRDSLEWLKEFEQLPALKQVTRDGGNGLEKGLKRLNLCRRQGGQSEVDDQEDHYHITNRGGRALREIQNKALRAYCLAEKVQAAYKRERRKGKVKNGRWSIVSVRWRQAEAAMDRWSVQEKAFQRLCRALRPFKSDGRLNTPEEAESEVRSALRELTGTEWSRLRSMLVGSKAFTFLRRAQERLAALPVSGELRQAAERVESLRRQPELLRQEGKNAGAMRGVLLASSLVLSLSGQAGAQALQLVRQVLNSLWRSSSLVESLNAVLRMQQCRQKRMTQGLLELKRLHWNLHVFVAGRRKGKSPYGRLGVVLPPGNWWQLLKRSPEQLRQELSALNRTA